jgi:hypothetical protein
MADSAALCEEVDGQLRYEEEEFSGIDVEIAVDTPAELLLSWDEGQSLEVSSFAS